MVNSVVIFLSQATLLKWLTCIIGSHTAILTVLLFWISFFLLALVIVLQWFSLHWEIMIMLLSQFSLSFDHIHNGKPRFIALLITVLILIEMVFLIIWEMFHGRISLNSMLLLLLVSFVSLFRLELMYMSFIRPSLTHLHDFQLLLLLP